MLNFYLYFCLLKQLFDHFKQQNLLLNIKKKEYRYFEEAYLSLLVL